MLSVCLPSAVNLSLFCNQLSFNGDGIGREEHSLVAAYRKGSKKKGCPEFYDDI
jgi:hypothetical protein